MDHDTILKQVKLRSTKTSRGKKELSKTYFLKFVLKLELKLVLKLILKLGLKLLGDLGG